MLDMKNVFLPSPSSQFYTAVDTDFPTKNRNVSPEVDYNLNQTVNIRRHHKVNQLNHPYDHLISHGHLDFAGFSSNSDRLARQFEEDDLLSPKISTHLVEISSKRIKTASFEEHTHPQPQQTTAKARRSQKLADKITVLQKLVSPYGKTNTADVLEEASLCIKHLHQQIDALCNAYNTNTEARLRAKESGTDLRRRGLYLVPVSLSWKVIADEDAGDFMEKIKAPKEF